jgi:hypothetical protein
MSANGAKTETPVAAVRAGGDLQVVVIRWDGDDTYLPKWEVVAFDSDGNPLATMGAFLSETVAYGLLPTLIDIAREAYGSEDAREMDDFNLVAWRVRGENGKGWTWAGAEPCDLGHGLGIPSQY